MGRNDEMMGYFAQNRPLRTLSKAAHPDDGGIRCELRGCLSGVLRGKWEGEGDITDGAKRGGFSFLLEDGLGLGWVNVAAVCVCKLFCVE